MIMDALAVFSLSQAITAAAASTSSMDLGPGSVRDIGTGENLYLVVVVTVAFTDAGSDSSVTVSIEGDSTSTFTPDGSENVLLIPALAAVNDTFICRLNPGSLALQYRYIQLRYTPNNGNLTTGSVTAFICHDVQKYKSYAKGYVIS